MSGYDTENSGVISKNDRKEKDTHADYKGNATIGDVDYWVDAWENARKDGSKDEDGKPRTFLKLKFKAKDQQRQAAKPRAPSGDLDSDAPF